jgi:hypothetical protein
MLPSLVKVKGITIRRSKREVDQTMVSAETAPSVVQNDLEQWRYRELVGESYLNGSS